MHLVLQMQPHVIFFYGVTSMIRFMFLLFPQISGTDGCYMLHTVGTNSIIVLMYNHEGCSTYRAPVGYVTKTWSVVLLNKKNIYSYLECTVYDKLLKPRQSF